MMVDRQRTTLVTTVSLKILKRYLKEFSQLLARKVTSGEVSLSASNEALHLGKLSNLQRSSPLRYWRRVT
jgi:hypothetical protein